MGGASKASMRIPSRGYSTFTNEGRGRGFVAAVEAAAGMGVAVAVGGGDPAAASSNGASRTGNLRGGGMAAIGWM